MIPPEIQALFDAIKEEMQTKIDDLQGQIDAFENAPEFEPNKKRTLGLLITSPSSKTPTSENQSVNESGAGSYSVLSTPDRFIKIGDYNFPAWDS